MKPMYTRRYTPWGTTYDGSQYPVYAHTGQDTDLACPYGHDDLYRDGHGAKKEDVDDLRGRDVVRIEQCGRRIRRRIPQYIDGGAGNGSYCR